MQLLSTRLYPPRCEGAVVARPAGPRLIRFAESRRLTVVKAPAGYGKTTLMVECYRHLLGRSQSAIWISLNEFDGSVEEFAAYLAQALLDQGLTVESGNESPGSGAAPSVRTICARIAESFGTLRDVLYVFLDDADAIHDSAAETLIAALIKECSDRVHWIVGSRSALGIPLARMRVLGQLGELDVDDLRFSRIETREFLSVHAAGAVSEALANFSHDRTEGWPAGLQLMSIALQRSGGDEAGLMARCSGKQRDIAAFFREEVFARLDKDMQGFLLDTCVLSRFTAPLCDAMTGRQDAQRMIQRLEESGLFVFALDENNRWYRHHHLFAEFMLDILRDRAPAGESALHLRASRWLSTQGLPYEAVEHAMRSGDESYTVQLLDRTWHILMGEGEVVRAAHLVSSVAEETLNRSPGVQLWCAMCMIVESRFGEARWLLSPLESQIEMLAADSEGDSLQVRQLRHMLLNRRMMLAAFSDDIDELERLIPRLLERQEECDERQEECDAFLQGTLQIGRLLAHRQRYRLRECDPLIASSRELFTGAGYRSMMVWHACIVGPVLRQRGEAEAAVAQYRNAVELARSCSQPGIESELLSMPLTMLAETLLESNKLHEAAQLFAHAEACANGIGIPDYWVSRYVGRARLAFHEGDAEHASRLLDEGHELASARSFERLRWAVAHERIRQALALGGLQAAQRIGKEAGLAHDEMPLRPSQDVTSAHELRAMTWARLAIATGRQNEALHLLRAWMTFVESRGAWASLARLSLLAVRALHAAGDGRGALRTMKQAIDHAGRTGLILSIVQEGEPIRSLAIKSLEGAAASGDSASLRRIADALKSPAALFGACAAPLDSKQIEAVLAPTEALTQREIDILRRVAHSMLYKEIADQVGLTEGSVKWYMQQIYGKLGVRRRQRAVEKGRLLGYF